jgi:ectonucleoside triphosphate diphosphohydrolase 4
VQFSVFVIRKIIYSLPLRRKIASQFSSSAYVRIIIFIRLFAASSFSSSWAIENDAHEDRHYAIVVDAGSSGSRAYLYHWPTHSGNAQELLKINPLTDDGGEPLVKSVSPGLSRYAFIKKSQVLTEKVILVFYSFGEQPGLAFDHIKPLMQYAADNIPDERHSSTPLFILATAGMRLIDHEQQEAIISNVRNGIASNFDFHFPDGNLEIISGKQEGIYQWLAINYVLDKFNQDKRGNNLVNMPDKDDVHDNNEYFIRPKTVGALDMGGASMQIGMEVTSDLSLEGFTVSTAAL